MILLVTRSDIELTAVLLSLHLADNIKLGKNVQCQILQLETFAGGLPSGSVGSFSELPEN